MNYEICVFQALRDKLRCKEIWAVGANRYRNPDDDLPKDFEERREENYKALNQPPNILYVMSSIFSKSNVINHHVVTASLCFAMKSNARWGISPSCMAYISSFVKVITSPRSACFAEWSHSLKLGGIRKYLSRSSGVNSSFALAYVV